MLKTRTFTILVTTAIRETGAEEQLRHAILGETASGGRVDVFEGDHLWAQPDSKVHEARRAHAAMHPKPRTWADLTPDEQATVLRHAEEYGGGFVSHLCSAWKRADGSNSAKLAEAFGAMLLEGYGHALESKV